MTSIAKRAFYNCKKITSIRIPDGVASIASQAFRNCTALERAYVPASVTSIASDALNGSKNCVLVVDENSWAHNWCLEGGVACTLSGNVQDGPTAVGLNIYEITLGVKEEYTLKPVDDMGNTDGFTFASSKTSVASVNANGKITAKKVGTAVITVSTFNGAQAECTVVVMNAPKSIKLSESKITILTGETHQLEWKLSAKSAGKVSFSTDSDCISVDENGMITAIAEGTAKITAKTFNGKKSTCTVTVKSSSYAITAMCVEGSRIYATVSTKSACTFYAEVLSEDGKKVLFDASAPAAEHLQMEEIFAETDRAFPQYYLLRGVLLDENGEALCNYYISKRYTAVYQEVESQQPSDYDQERVLDFGKAGFGVLADSVIVIHSKALVSGDEYIFETDREINAGDVLLLNGEPVKVGDVVAGGGGGGGHARIRRDRKVNVQEVYKTINLDGYVDLGDAYKNGANAKLYEVENDEAIVEILKIKKDFEIGDHVTVTPELGGTARIRLLYNEEKFGKDYFETEFYVEVGGKVDVFLGFEFKKDKTIELMDVPLPIGPTGLAFDLELNIPLSFDAKAGGTATYNFSMKKGVAYTPDMGKQEINEEPKPTIDFKLAGEFTASIGISVSGGVTFLDDCLRAALNGEVGLQGKGEWAPVNTADSMNEAQTHFHACQQCLEITASVYGEFSVSLNARFNEKGEDKEVVKFPIVRAEIPVFELYYSIANEPLSVHGGTRQGGKGDCPNNKYRTTVYTVDEYGEDITGIGITVNRMGMAPLSGWINGTMGGSETVILQVKNGKLTVVKEFTLSNRTDKIYVEGKFSTNTKFSGTIYPTKTKFTAKAFESSWTQGRKGKEIWAKNAGRVTYQENEEGFYDLLYVTTENCLFNADYVGSSYTLYKMENGKLEMKKQWYEGAAG